MNRYVNGISGRLLLRPPQRRSLEILDRITEISQPGKDAEAASVLEVIRSEFPSVADFERDFPSLCFALATGVGKTRLMGAFISYLHLAHGINNGPIPQSACKPWCWIRRTSAKRQLRWYLNQNLRQNWGSHLNK